MKKLLTLLLCVCMIGSIGVFSSCASSTEASTSVETVTDKVKSETKSTVLYRAYVKYGYWAHTITTYVDQSYTDENKYYVSGKYTINDNYGDSYTGKYDVTVVYDPVTGECEVTSCELQTAYKN